MHYDYEARLETLRNMLARERRYGTEVECKRLEALIREVKSIRDRSAR